MSEIVAVCDDEPGNVGKWVGRLQGLLNVGGRFQVEPHTEFLDDVRELEARRTAVRRHSPRKEVETLFDTAAVLVVDYDLLSLGDNQYVTGEAVAYLARCYSRCGVIIVLNQYGANRFDLTLRGHPDSFADINIGSEQLHNPFLWGMPALGFNPWVWPVIPDMLDRHRRRVADLLQNGLDRAVSKVLGLSPETIGGLPRSARAFIEVDKHELKDITFRQVAGIDGPMLERKDDLADEGAKANVASARVARWCEDCLLPEQDLLVDAPHLVTRFPSLLTGDLTVIETWDAVADRRAGYTWKPQQEHMAAYAFQAEDWVSRPVWWGRRLGENTNLREVVDPWKSTAHPLVFCEDVSRFAPPDATRSFIADLESPYVKRSIADHHHSFFASVKSELDAVDYQPLVRLSR